MTLDFIDYKKKKKIKMITYETCKEEISQFLFPLPSQTKEKGRES